MEEGRKGKPSPKGKRGLNRKGFLSSIFFPCRSSSSSALAFVPLHNPCAIARPDRCDETPTASDFHKEAGQPAVPPGAQWPSRPADGGQDEAACQKGHPQDEQSWTATARPQLCSLSQAIARINPEGPGAGGRNPREAEACRESLLADKQDG